MTRAYLESVFSSSSSIGGLVIPSGAAAVPAMRAWLLACARRRPAGQAPLDRHQGYQARGGLLDRRVDHDLVELALGRQLDPGGGQPALDLGGVLGAPAGEAADQLVERRRGEE